MKAPRLTARSVWVGALIVLGLAVSTWVGVPGGRDGRTSGVASAQATSRPTNSSSIAITSDDRFVWSVNPDNASVSVFEVLSRR